MEELRAELASAFMAGELGIPADIPNHASYIGNWIKPLKDDKREIFRACADAQRIVDMVLGFHPNYAQNAETAQRGQAHDGANGAERPGYRAETEANLTHPASL